MKYFIGIISLLLSIGAVSAEAASVDVQKSTQGWTLRVDGREFFVKGVGCSTGTGPNNENYFEMAQQMGANAIRTWGVKPREFFDAAHKNGLLVNAGVWFNPVRRSETSYTDKAFTSKLKADTLDFVRANKDHPAILSWNLGNEVFTFTKSESEKRAFGRFLGDLIDAVHREDPAHPVVYACASHKELPYLKKYARNIDIVGMNTYGGYNAALRWLKTNNFDKPVLATEFGCHGPWTQKKDLNGIPFDPFDQYKAGDLISLWTDIVQSTGQSLGGFAFVLGNQRNQGSLTWFNLNYDGLKRQSYWTMYKLYTGLEPANKPPKIRFMKLNRINRHKKGEPVYVTLAYSDPDGDTTTVDYFFSRIADDPLIVEKATLLPAVVEAGEDGKTKVFTPNETGIFRLYALVKDSKGNAAVANRSVRLD